MLKFQVREKIILALAKIRIDSFIMVENLASAMFEVMKEKEELTDISLTSAIALVNNITKCFVEFNTNAGSEESLATGK